MGKEGQVMDWYEVINSLARFYADTAAAVESNPPELCVAVAGGSRPLARVVRDEVVRAIFRWPQWQLLLQTSVGGYLQPPAAAGRTSRRIITPTRSDDLVRPFEGCVKELDRFTRDKAGESITGLLTRMAEQLRPQREALQAFCQDAALRERVKDKVGPENADLVDVLLEAVDPTHLGARLRDVCLGCDGKPDQSRAEGEETLPPLSPAAVFPLPVGLKFGWNEEIWRDLSPDQRSDHTHQSWVPRIRDTLISSVEEALLSLVGEINNRAACHLRKECHELSFLVQNEIVAGAHDFLPALVDVLSDSAGTAHAA